MMSQTFTITGVGVTDSVKVRGSFDVSLNGFGDATVYLEIKYNDQQGWVGLVEGQKFTSNYSGVANIQGGNVAEARFNCTAYNSGTIIARVGD